MEYDLEVKVKIFPSKEDRDLLLLEARNDPNFAAQLSKALDLPDGQHLVAASAHKAILNHLNPDLHSDLSGAWPILRSIINEVVSHSQSSAEADIKKTSKSTERGLGQFDILGPIIGAVASAGASIYSANVQANAQRQIAADQLQANMAEIQAQEAMVNARTAIANAQTAQAVQQYLPASLAAPVASAVNTLNADVGGGIKLWELALLGYFIWKEIR